jgi:hypothetical protein
MRSVYGASLQDGVHLPRKTGTCPYQGGVGRYRFPNSNWMREQQPHHLAHDHHRRYHDHHFLTAHSGCPDHDIKYNDSASHHFVRPATPDLS